MVSVGFAIKLASIYQPFLAAQELYGIEINAILCLYGLVD
jgi:hypothetical protein